MDAFENRISLEGFALNQSQANHVLRQSSPCAYRQSLIQSRTSKPHINRTILGSSIVECRLSLTFKSSVN